MNAQRKDSGFHAQILRRRGRYLTVFALLLAAFGLITVWNINTGNVHIPVDRILRILLTKTGQAEEVNIIWKIRLPRILMAAVLGGALALSGFLLQTFFSNPIAGPFVLGISSGAKMTVAAVMILFIGRERRDASPSMRVSNGCPARMPLISLVVVPEFPASRGILDGLRP